MRCSKCDAAAVTHIAYSGQHLCDKHFLYFFEKRAKMEVHRQGRLPKGRVVVALSGGKDSMALLYFLAELTKDRPDVELAAVTVDEGIAGYRDTSLPLCEAACRDLGVPWHVIRTADMAGYSIDAYAAGQGKDPVGETRPACGPCGVYRRTGMNRVARELGAAALATGHNLDDSAQTILMNVLEGDVDRLDRLAPHTRPQPGLIPRIQPLRTIPEKEVLLYCLLKGIEFHDAECPYAARARRWRIRDVLWELESTTPGTRHSLLAFHERLKPRLEATSDASPTMARCGECGEPASGALCAACLWKV